MTKSRDILYPTPFRLGLFLERTNVNCAAWPRVSYRGVDRLPLVPGPEDMDRVREAESPVDQLWESFWELEESNELNRNLSAAVSLQHRFQMVGIELEVVHVEIVAFPDFSSESHARAELWTGHLETILPPWLSVHALVPVRSAQWPLIGYDLSYPIPSFHSAIFQPGLAEVVPDLPDRLNENGLFGELEVALGYLPAANDLVPQGLPFCVLGVWEVRAS